MQIESRQSGGVLVIEVQGENLDAALVQTFSTLCRQEIARANLAWVVLDLQQLQCVDSTGLGALLGLMRHISEKGGDLRLAQVQPSVLTSLQVFRMEQLFDRFCSVEAAILSFAMGVS